MKIKDIVYNEVEVNEPVLLELLDSKPIVRLKSISQLGLPDKYSEVKNFSRYEHSVGVMLLLRRLGATVEEQVAGLLHDVSHSAFSHVTDWVFGDGENGNESYHDSRYTDFIQKTDVPKILRKHGFSMERILDESNFPLLENHSPDVCADRLDYSLREIAHSGRLEVAPKVLKGLIVKGSQIVFPNIENGQLFANEFLDIQVKHWGAEQTIKRYAMFARAFKIAITTGLMKHDDFWDKSEGDLMRRLIYSGNAEILDILKRLETGNLGLSLGIKVNKKFRYVDPFVACKEQHPKAERD